MKFWWLFINFNFISSFFWHSFSHLRRNWKKLKFLKSHQNFSFWPIFKNSGSKWAEDQGLSKKNKKKFLRGSKGVKKIKKSKNCVIWSQILRFFWFFWFFDPFRPSQIFFLLFFFESPWSSAHFGPEFLKIGQKLKFWWLFKDFNLFSPLSGRILTRPVGVPISDFFFLKVHVFSYPKIYISQNRIFIHFFIQEPP